VRVDINIKGLDHIVKSLKQFPGHFARYMQAAGMEFVNRYLFSGQGYGRGLYPPAGPGNQLPHPYYIRGRGTQTSDIHNLGESQRLGSNLYVRPVASKPQVEFGTRGVTYAEYAVGEKQSRVMANIGWEKFTSKIKRHGAKLSEVYSLWIIKLLKDVKLIP